VVDTHTIVPELGGNGLLKVFPSENKKSQIELCVWIWKRLSHSGVTGKAMQSFIEVIDDTRYVGTSNELLQVHCKATSHRLHKPCESGH
jgi:hypothetical protein